MQAPPPSRAWLASIDLLRGVAALMVAIHHANGAFWRTHHQVFWGKADEFMRNASVGEWIMLPLAGFGFLGVPLFFVISGFCIHLPLAGKDKPLKPRQFAIRRFFRLYPLYFAVVVGVFALLWLGGRREVATPGNLLGHLVFWVYNAPPEDGARMGISPVLWSVVVEVQFYVLYALLLPLLRKVGFARCAVIGLCVDVAYRLFWSSLGPTHAGLHEAMTPYVFSPARFGEWLLGAWIAESYVRGTLGTGPLSSANLRMALGWALVVLAIIVVAALGVDRYWLDVPTTIGFALILASMVGRERRQGPPGLNLFWKGAKWLGDRSYSLYLVHFTVILVCVEAAARLMGKTSPEQKDELGGSLTLLGAIAVAIPAVLIVTDLAYRLIELPTHKLGRKLSESPAPPAPPPPGVTPPA